MNVHDLPAVNAGLNALSTLFLLAGYAFIRAERKKAHAAMMVCALGTSAVFLATYVAHKILVKGVHTPFGGEGLVRTFYYAMLASHILLAMAIVPMVLVTMNHALRARFDRHRRIARWTWPVWMYVSVTGVLVYFMLYQWFPKAGA
jgi:uncharacterized membrane protein YozB (DUF420 family)